MLLQQLRSEKEFVEKENQQLRHPEAKTAKVTVWLDRERTCQAEVQLGESDDIIAVAAAVSRAHSLDAAEGRALLEQLQRSYLALRTASAWSASMKSAPAAEASGGGPSSGWAVSFDGASSPTLPSSSTAAFAQSGAFDTAFDAFDPDAPGGDAAGGHAQQQQQQQHGFSGMATALAVDPAAALSPGPMDSPPPEVPPSRFQNLVPTCFQWFGACHMVYLAGSFNEWKERIPLQNNSRNRDWAVVLNLPPGEYTYKYVVQEAAEESLSWHHAPDQPTGCDQLGNVNNFVTVMDQSEYEVEEAEDAGYSQREPDEHFFLGPEPPSLPRHLLHLLGGVAPHAIEPPAAHAAMQGMQWGELQGMQGLPMPEAPPLLHSGVSGVMEGVGLGEGVGSSAEHSEQSRGGHIDHSALEHLCVSMDWHGCQAGQAAAGSWAGCRSSLPPAVALSVTHRYRGRIIETVLVKPLPGARLAGIDAPMHPAPLPGVPVGQW